MRYFLFSNFFTGCEMTATLISIPGLETTCDANFCDTNSATISRPHRARSLWRVRPHCVSGGKRGHSEFRVHLLFHIASPLFVVQLCSATCGSRLRSGLRIKRDQCLDQRNATKIAEP
jgi:hypothetical protein